MLTPTFTFTPVIDDTKNGGQNARSNDDWKSYAIAAAIAINGGFRQAAKRMVGQAKEKAGQLPPSAYRVVAHNVCDIILAAERRRFERASMLKQTALDGMRSITGSELQELKEVLEQICSLLELRS